MLPLLKFVLCICIFLFPTQVCVFSPPQVCTLGEASVYVYIIFHSKVVLSIGSQFFMLTIQDPSHGFFFTNGKYNRNLTFSDTSWPGVLFCSCPRILCHHGPGNLYCFVLVFELLSWFRWKCEWYGPWLPNMKAWQCNIDILPKPWYLRSTLNWQCKKEIHPPEIF